MSRLRVQVTANPRIVESSAKLLLRSGVISATSRGGHR